MDTYLQHELYKFAKHSSSTVIAELLGKKKDIPIRYSINVLLNGCLNNSWASDYSQILPMQQDLHHSYNGSRTVPSLSSLFSIIYHQLVKVVFVVKHLMFCITVWIKQQGFKCISIQFSSSDQTSNVPSN